FYSRALLSSLHSSLSLLLPSPHFSSFFFTDPSPTEIYTLSLHDALPISSLKGSGAKESVMEFRLVPSRWVCTAPMYMKIEAARATRRLMMVIVALSGQKSSDLSV